MTTCADAAARSRRPARSVAGRRTGSEPTARCSTPGRPGAARSRPSTASTRTADAPWSRPGAPDDPLALRAEAARRHEAVVLERLIDRCSGRVVDLRLLAADGPEVQAAATRRALADGVDVVVGGVLPLDLDGHRSGAPDLLVRGADGPDGRPTYHPVLVVWHKVLTRRAPRRPRSARPVPSLPWTSFARPSPLDPAAAPLGRGPAAAVRGARPAPAGPPPPAARGRRVRRGDRRGAGWSAPTRRPARGTSPRCPGATSRSRCCGPPTRTSRAGYRLELGARALRRGVRPTARRRRGGPARRAAPGAGRRHASAPPAPGGSAAGPGWTTTT